MGEEVMTHCRHGKPVDADNICYKCKYEDNNEYKKEQVQKWIAKYNAVSNELITLREENESLRVELEDANKALFDEGKLQCDTVEMHFDPKGTASVVKGLKEKNITLESEVERYREALIHLKHNKHHSISEELWKIDSALSEGGIE